MRKDEHHRDKYPPLSRSLSVINRCLYMNVLLGTLRSMKKTVVVDLDYMRPSVGGGRRSNYYIRISAMTTTTTTTTTLLIQCQQ